MKWYLGIAAVLAFGFGIMMNQSARADFQTLDGQEHQWQDLHGKWVVINYFAQWCAPCLREVPELNAFAQQAEIRQDIALFAVDFDALPNPELRALADKYQMQFPIITANQQAMPMDKPQQLPATYIISPQGEVVKRLIGEQTSDSLIATIDRLQRL